MKTTFINTEEAPNKWWAAQDARMRSIANASHYADSAKIRAERMRYALELAYAGRFFNPKYGKRGITIKIENARVRDRKILQQLEADYALQGVLKRVSPQGINYYIPRAV
jgi:hypothetical protein